MADWNAVFQNCWYVGNNFNAILYGATSVPYPLRTRGPGTNSRFIASGIAVVFYLKIARLILKSRRVDQPRGSDKWLFVLSTGLMVMITIYLIAQNFFGEEMWVINEGYAGGSEQYYADHAAVWYQTMGSAASVILCLMSDAFLVRHSELLFRIKRSNHKIYTLFAFVHRSTGHMSCGLTGA